MKLLTRLLVLATLIAIPAIAPAGAFHSGSVACPTSGSKQVVTARTMSSWWLTAAAGTNAGKIYVGDSTISTTTGVYLNAGDSFLAPPISNIAAYDLSTVWFVCGTNTDSLTFTYLQ